MLVLFSGLLQPAAALELFGVTLESTSRGELRDAVKKAGLVLIREGGEDHWFDLYDSSAVLDGSTRFYLGFVKKDQRFAFAEYEFRGLGSKQLTRLDQNVAEVAQGEGSDSFAAGSRDRALIEQQEIVRAVRANARSLEAANKALGTIIDIKV